MSLAQEVSPNGAHGHDAREQEEIEDLVIQKLDPETDARLRILEVESGHRANIARRHLAELLLSQRRPD